MLRLLRDEVVPLIRSLKRLGLASYHFLIHDRHSGVPVATDGSYIHLRLSFKKPQVLDVGGKFEMTRPVDTTTQATVSGIDGTLLVGKDPQARMKTFTRLLELQSEWALALIEAHNWKDDADMVRQVLQFGHFLSNMLQMQFR